MDVSLRRRRLRNAIEWLLLGLVAFSWLWAIISLAYVLLFAMLSVA